MEMQANNQDKQRLMENIANFKTFYFPDIRKHVFLLEQFVTYTCISNIEAFIFFSIPNASRI